jgi:L-alanine-DL-glutamate epimerase-like enolase superfamily enzyme
MTAPHPTAGAAGDVPVEDLEVRVYTVPTDAPEGDGTLTWDSTTIVLVRVRAGGQVGTGWTYGPPACASVVRDQLRDLVVGSSALDPPARTHAGIDAVRNAGRPGVTSCAISAVDVALWDLKARLLGLPLHRLLGALRDEVAVYGSGGFTTYDDARTTEQLEGWVGQGIGRVKIKIGESAGADVARDLARVRLARKVIGDDVELFVDANGGYGVGQAVRVGRQLDELGVLWFEEPVTSDDLDGLHEVRSRVGADVTAGEYGYDLTYFRRMCEAQSVDCLQVDASRCGGVTEWLRAAAVAASYHLDVSAHCAPHLHAHVAAATPRLRHLEWFHDHVRIEQLFFDGALDPSGGTLRLTDAPGLGLELREQDAERYRVA